MATLTIRNLDDDVRDFLREQAASHGRSMEAEVRAILEAVKARAETKPEDIAKRIHARFAKIGDVTLEQPMRPAAQDPVTLE